MGNNDSHMHNFKGNYDHCPSNYFCKICMSVGNHWIMECPDYHLWATKKALLKYISNSDKFHQALNNSNPINSPSKQIKHTPTQPKTYQDPESSAQSDIESEDNSEKEIESIKKSKKCNEILRQDIDANENAPFKHLVLEYGWDNLEYYSNDFTDRNLLLEQLYELEEKSNNPIGMAAVAQLIKALNYAQYKVKKNEQHKIKHNIYNIASKQIKYKSHQQPKTYRDVDNSDQFDIQSKDIFDELDNEISKEINNQTKQNPPIPYQHLTIDNCDPFNIQAEDIFDELDDEISRTINNQTKQNTQIPHQHLNMLFDPDISEPENKYNGGIQRHNKRNELSPVLKHNNGNNNNNNNNSVDWLRSNPNDGTMVNKNENKKIPHILNVKPRPTPQPRHHEINMDKPKQDFATFFATLKAKNKYDNDHNNHEINMDKPKQDFATFFATLEAKNKASDLRRDKLLNEKNAEICMEVCDVIDAYDEINGSVSEFTYNGEEYSSDVSCSYVTPPSKVIYPKTPRKSDDIRIRVNLNKIFGAKSDEMH